MLGLVKKHQIGAKKVRDEMVALKSREPAVTPSWYINYRLELLGMYW